MITPKKTPSGRWRTQPFKKLKDGTCIRGSITADSKKECERLTAIWYSEQNEKAKKETTLREAFKSYIRTCKNQGYSPSTIAEYTSRMHNSYSNIIDWNVSAITPQSVQKQIDERSESVSIKTVRNDFFLLKAVLAFYAPNVDLSKVRIAKKPKRKKMIMQESWRTDIPKKILELYGRCDLYLYVILLIFAGIRPSEAFALQWMDISALPIETANSTKKSQKMGSITINKAIVRNEERKYIEKAPKTESGNRTQLLSWALIKEIESVHKRGQPEDRIFTENPYKFVRKWNRIKAELNLPHELTIYHLRHHFATTVAYSGASEEELASRMGHSTSSFSHSVYVEIFGEKNNAINAVLSDFTSKAIKDITLDFKHTKTPKKS